MKTYRLELAYDGTRYKGWQKQGNTANTIQEKTETILTRIVGEKTEIAASGRTDAGVHAKRQVCSFHSSTNLSCEEILAALRKYLPEDIGAMSLSEAPPRFHARLNCTGKTYLYRLWVTDVPNVFERNFICRMPGKYDVEKMRRAAALLCGEHDFTAFTSNRHMKKSAVRNLRSIEISETENELLFLLEGNGFLYNMVRIIVGTLLEVGEGKREPAEMAEILSSRVRENAGFTAPAEGLVLLNVAY